MQIEYVKSNTKLYETLVDMGITLSPSAAIHQTLGNCPIYKILPLTSQDINKVSYYGKHFMITAAEKVGLEVWIGDEYINPERLTWVEQENNEKHVYGVLDLPYRHNDEVRVMSNPNIIFRYSAITEDIDVQVYRRVVPEKDVEGIDIYQSCYYISGGIYYKPNITHQKNSKQYVVDCIYQHDLDVFCVGNMQFCDYVDPGVGILVDDVLSQKVYSRFILGTNDTYTGIDARFYPWICLKDGGFLRLYTDMNITVRNPMSCRLINYPEFIDVEDPYNTDNEYLNNFESNTIVIDGTEPDFVIYEKYRQMMKEWYRCYESYTFYRYQSCFHLYHNTEYDNNFYKAKLLLSGGIEKDVVLSSFPFDIDRDVIFYNGKMHNEYSTGVLHKLEEGCYELAPPQAPRVNHQEMFPVYILDGSLEEDKFSVIKFTASGEDTVITNINYFLDKENFLILYTKINKFYRNLAFLENASFTEGDLGEELYIGKELPPIDERLWIELLTVADEDVVKAIANLVPDKITGIMPKSILETLAKPLTPEEITTELHKLRSEQNLTIDDFEHHDVWIEWLTTIKGYVHFSKDNSIIMNLNENVYLIELLLNAEKKEDVQIFAFDDIVMHFRENKYGSHYLSILADLYKSNVVTDHDIVVFYDRLITSIDNCKPDLERVTTYTGNVITKLDRKLSDISIIYSTNLGRIQFNRDHFTEEEILYLRTHTFSYANIPDFTFLPDRVLLFVNGRLIEPKDIIEYNDFIIHINNFDERIETIDIFYNLIDMPLMKLKRISMEEFPLGENFILTDEDLEIKDYYRPRMKPIEITGKTYKGYYDVLYRDFFMGGGMNRRLKYYTEHPEEFEDFKKDLLEMFSPITSKGALSDYKSKNKILLWGSLNSHKYELGRKE